MSDGVNGLLEDVYEEDIPNHKMGQDFPKPVLDLSQLIIQDVNGHFRLKHRCRERRPIDEIETVL